MDPNATSNITILFHLIIALIFTFMEILEINKIWLVWESSQKMFEINFFNNCIKYQIIVKGVYACYGLLISFTAVFLTFFLYVSIDYFIEKVIPTFFNYIYYIFGPLMLAFTLIGFLNWEDVLYVCPNSRFLNSRKFINNFLEISKNYDYYIKENSGFKNILKDYKEEYLTDDDKENYNFISYIQVDKIISEKSNGKDMNKFLFKSSFDHGAGFYPIDLNYENNWEKDKQKYQHYLLPHIEEINYSQIEKNKSLNDSEKDFFLPKKDKTKYLVFEFLKDDINKNFPNENIFNLTDDYSRFNYNSSINTNNSNFKKSNINKHFHCYSTLRNDTSLNMYPIRNYFLFNNNAHEKSFNNSSHNRKILSVPNAFNLILGLLTSSVLCFLMSIHESQYYFIDSILRKSNGNPLLAFLFWKTIHVWRERERDRSRQRENNQRNNILNGNQLNNNINNNTNDRIFEQINTINQENENTQVNFNCIIPISDSNIPENIRNDNYERNNDMILIGNENAYNFKNENYELFNNCNVINQTNFRGDLNCEEMKFYDQNNISRKLDKKIFDLNQNLIELESNCQLRNPDINPNIVSNNFIDVNLNMNNSSEDVNLDNSNSTINNMNRTICKYYSLIKYNKVEEKKFYSNNNLRLYLEDFNNYKYQEKSFDINHRKNSDIEYKEYFYNFSSDIEDVVRSRSMSSKTFEINLRNVL